MNLKNKTCPLCGKENTTTIKSDKKFDPKQTIIKFAICLFFTVIALLPFFVKLIRKEFAPTDWSFWASIVLITISLIPTIFYFTKWLKTRKYYPIEVLYCKNCGYFETIKPEIKHNQNEEN